MITMKEWRDKNGYTLEEASKKLDVSVQAIKKYEERPGKTPIHIIAMINYR
ncbi:helix-turn-helix transcriptional regulator [Paenibacillus sp. FSL H7-0326]|uniref:helix-turn-helix domain-containing protein n=1 Tax=Paenibacillus sp. FSL H7-0326 TaxID=1921144 RepID=UPI0009F92EB5|nr:helix-turn-helix transcriptional regulator [Paenibacillus sp. FSL H7-0326]